jgi:hypothetical protein
LTGIWAANYRMWLKIRCIPHDALRDAVLLPGHALCQRPKPKVMVGPKNLAEDL